MKYTKPAVMLVDRAVETIQGMPKHGLNPDSDDGFITAAAYDADE